MPVWEWLQSDTTFARGDRGESLEATGGESYQGPYLKDPLAEGSVWNIREVAGAASDVGDVVAIGAHGSLE
eukprot:753444-Pyramimonas_sp.AAC.1